MQLTTYVNHFLNNDFLLRTDYYETKTLQKKIES